LVSKTVDFTDLRVREFTKDEIHGNRDFLEVSEEMAEITFKIQKLQDAYSIQKAANQTGAFSGILRKSPDGFIASLKEEIEDLRKKRDGLMPQWWRETATK